MSSSSSSECEIEPKSKKIKYDQKYKDEWERIPQYKGWVQKSKKGDSFALCLPCDKNINIKSGKNALTKHSQTTVHKDNSNTIIKQKSITSFLKPSASTASGEQEIKEGR